MHYRLELVSSGSIRDECTLSNSLTRVTRVLLFPPLETVSHLLSSSIVMPGSDLAQLLPYCLCKLIYLCLFPALASTMSADLSWFICHTEVVLAQPFSFFFFFFVCFVLFVKHFAALTFSHNPLAAKY